MKINIPKGEGPHILVYDLETTPWIGMGFGKVYDPRIVEVTEESYILCYAYKWLGEKKTYFLKAKRGNDKQIVKALHKLFDSADILIAYNGDRFDQPTANTRFMHYGLGPPSPYKTIDPLKVNRREFRYPSNKLDYVLKAHGLEGKTKSVGMDIWKRCMKSDLDKEAWALMEKYNLNDTVRLEEEYEKVKPWIRNHPNVGFWKKGESVCNKCGSSSVIKRGIYRTTTSEFQAYQCKSCGGYSRARVAIKEEKPSMR